MHCLFLVNILNFKLIITFLLLFNSSLYCCLVQWNVSFLRCLQVLKKSYFWLWILKPLKVSKMELKVLCLGIKKVLKLISSQKCFFHWLKSEAFSSHVAYCAHQMLLCIKKHISSHFKTHNLFGYSILIFH